MNGTYFNIKCYNYFLGRCLNRKDYKPRKNNYGLVSLTQELKVKV